MDAYQKAQRRVQEQKKFYAHLISYVSVGIFLMALNLITSPGHFWFLYPMLGWGIGLSSHYFRVFGMPGSGVGSKEWEEKALQQELRRLGKNPDSQSDEYLELRELDQDPARKTKASGKGWSESDLV